MAITVTNTVASQALRSQAVKVTLSAAETASKLPLVQQGMEVIVDNNQKVGYVYRVDYYGNSFLVKTLTPATDLSSVAGYLAAAQTLTVI